MDSTWWTVLLSNDRWLFIEYFLGFVESVCVFYTSMFLVPKRALLSTLATPPVSFTPTGTSSSFFALRKTPLHSPFVLKWCDLICLFFPPFTSLSLVHGTSSSQPARCCFITFSFSPLRLSLAWKFSSVFCVLSSAHTLQRRLSVCSRRISLSVSSFPPLCESGGISCRRSR